MCGYDIDFERHFEFAQHFSGLFHNYQVAFATHNDSYHDFKLWANVGSNGPEANQNSKNRKNEFSDKHPHYGFGEISETHSLIMDIQKDRKQLSSPAYQLPVREI
jgi:hypothetical protein